MGVKADGLPAGLHNKSLVDLNSYAFTSHRAALLAALEALVAQLIAYGLAGQILIGGSFLVGRNRHPADIDCAVALQPSTIQSLDSTQKNALLALLENKSCRERGVDLYCFNAEDFHQQAYWLGLYGFSREGRKTRGIVKVQFDGRKAKGMASDRDREGYRADQGFGIEAKRKAG